MDAHIRRALERGNVIDITTIGRRSGAPRRIEIVYHVFGGRIYISGMPGRPRDWLANLAAHPEFTFHLKGTIEADLPARARVITDEADRRAIMPLVAAAWRRTDVDRMVESSPLVEVEVEGLEEPAA